MELQVGDRLIDQDFEWEVLTRPAVLHGAKSLRARLQRPGLPGKRTGDNVAGHVRVKVRRGPTER